MEWQLLAAETIGGVNQLLWKNIPANRLHQWTLDSNWTRIGSTGWDDPSSPAGQLLEARYGVDGNGDGQVCRLIESADGVGLLSSGTNRAYSVALTQGGGVIPILAGGSQLVEESFGADWQLLAAETIGGVNQLLWKNIPANRLHQWRLDENWNWMGFVGWDDPGSLAGKQLEARYGVDVDGDQIVRAWSAGSTGVDVLTATGGNTLFAPLGVGAQPGGAGVDQIISGGGRNQYLIADVFKGGIAYGAAGAADYLLIDGFNPSTDQLLLANTKVYGITPLTIGSTAGLALYEDRNDNGLYNAVDDDLLVLLRGNSYLPPNAIVMG